MATLRCCQLLNLWIFQILHLSSQPNPVLPQNKHDTTNHCYYMYTYCAVSLVLVDMEIKECFDYYIWSSFSVLMSCKGWSLYAFDLFDPTTYFQNCEYGQPDVCFCVKVEETTKGGTIPCIRHSSGCLDKPSWSHTDSSLYSLNHTQPCPGMSW